MTHLNIIRWIDYLLGAFFILIGIGLGVVFIIGAGALGFTGDEGSGIIAAFIFGSFGIVFAIFFLILGIIDIIAGSALINFKGWAKWYNIICIGIPNITALWGIYVIWALLFNEEVKTLFENRY